MKQMAITFVFTICFFFCIEIICNQLVEMQYEETLTFAVENSIRHTLELLGNHESDFLASEQDLFASFLQELTLEIGDQAEYDISVYELNYEQGIMDLEVKLTFSLPFGGDKAISCRKRGKLSV